MATAKALEGSDSNSEVSALVMRLKFSESLLSKAEEFRSTGKIQGIHRIVKQIKAEMTMLNKLISGEMQVKKHHVNSTNLLHLEGVLHMCQYAPKVTAVESTFKYNDGRTLQTAVVDVISNEGSLWIKLFARKRQALHKKWQGEGNFGEKTVSDFAHDYIQASKQNLHNFNTPSIIFVFFDGITESIADELHQMGIVVIGPIYSDDSQEEAPSPLQIASMFKNSMSVVAKPVSIPIESIHECTRVNFDVSSMLAWVSFITHNKETIQFSDLTLAEQAKQEKHDPLWPKLQAATQGKTLLACHTAVTDFRSIISIVGGPDEQERGRQLLSRIQEVKDEPSERALRLRSSGKIKERAKIVFGTGDQLKAVTLSSNEGFVRSAAGQGVHFNVIIHPCRALAEVEHETQILQEKTQSLKSNECIDHESCSKH